MSNRELTKTLYAQLREHDYKGKIVAIEHLRELNSEISTRRRQGETAPGIDGYLSSFTDMRDVPPGARSIIIVAAPQPQFQLEFHHDGNVIPVTIPPTYLLTTDRLVSELLEQILSIKGYHITSARLPQKLLAVRSGLGRYGKNNICYIGGMGSFHRPVTFFSDLPCIEDNWQNAGSMKCCSSCTICTQNCPTGAISPERFLVHADRCLTLQNELPGPFPDWVDPAWHHSLIGCMRCQSVCPVNKDHVHRVERKEVFTENETALLLAGTPKNRLPAATLQKIERLDMIESGYYDILPRNLNVLIKPGKL